MSHWPHFSPDVIEAAAEVLRSGKVNYWTGPHGKAFEGEFAAATGRKFGVALANGTLALELALRVCGVGPGDEVVVTPRSFVASASTVVTAGAVPVFADVDRDGQNLSAETIAPVLSPRTKAIIAVHLAGRPCEMDEINALARPRGVRVIEDCAQAHGATYKGRPVGSLGDVAAWSFCQDKILTTAGEGGLLATDSEEVFQQAWSWKDHGKSYEACFRRKHPPGFRWLHEGLGSNWRMTEVQSAVGRAVLRKLPDWVATRRRFAARFDECFARLPGLRVTPAPAHIGHAYYKYYAFVRPDRLKPDWSRDRILSALEAEGVPGLSGSCSEIYLEKAFENLRPPQRLPVARELGETSLMFLVHPTLTDEHIGKVCGVVERVMASATA